MSVESYIAVLDELIEVGKHPERYVSGYTSWDSGKTSGLIKARELAKDHIEV
ncbi:hypothetical protein KAR91_59680 [Candidatus Pacearchaeota archaeon]|nr:hypothetical protein [Candidatus Pacearchaeota archaeon]